MAPFSSKPMLEARRISKSFGIVRTLYDVDFSVYSGEVHTLMGENGAGKSTLLKIVGGIHASDAGEILFDGRPVKISSPHAARKLGIALMHQEPLVFPDLDVAENIFLGRETANPLFSRVRWRQWYNEAAALLASLGVRIDPRRRMSDLSIADRQMVEMAGALSQKARLLLMDEPTASLTPREVEDFFRIIRQIKAQGTAIVFISHRMEEVMAISDRITVLRDGKLVGACRRDETTTSEIIRMMVGRPIEAFYEREKTTHGKPLLEVDDLAADGYFADVSFTLKAGEVIGMAGLVGAGRTDVARSLFGLLPVSGGQIRVAGETVVIRSPSDAIKNGLAMIPEDRQEQGLLLPQSVAENTTAAHLGRLFPRQWITPAREREIADRYRDELRIVSRASIQPVKELSGGNQQKVVLAKWLLTGPRILILDEPTRGIDVGAKQEVHRLMGELAKAGKGILLISSDLLEVLALSDRVLVMREGRITAELSREEATAESVMTAAAGGVKV